MTSVGISGWPRAIFCLGAFCCTLFLTAVIIYTTDSDIEKNIEDLLVRKNKTLEKGNDTDKDDINNDIPVPNGLIEQELPLDEPNIVIVQPRTVRCHCFLCKIPLEPLLQTDTATHEPSGPQFGPNLHRFLNGPPMLPQPLFGNPREYSPPIQSQYEAGMEYKPSTSSDNDYSYEENGPEYRHISFRTIVDNNGNKKGFVMKKVIRSQNFPDVNDEHEVITSNNIAFASNRYGHANSCSAHAEGPCYCPIPIPNFSYAHAQAFARVGNKHETPHKKSLKHMEIKQNKVSAVDTVDHVEKVGHVETFGHVETVGNVDTAGHVDKNDDVDKDGQVDANINENSTDKKQKSSANDIVSTKMSITSPENTFNEDSNELHISDILRNKIRRRLQEHYRNRYRVHEY